ncbi:MAG TPA: hypothetical protein VEI97_10430 [bacterium]|nr:hypothetical protein [bacterium]
MSRYVPLASILALSALVAWGCGGTESNRTPVLPNTDGLNQPAAPTAGNLSGGPGAPIGSSADDTPGNDSGASGPDPTVSSAPVGEGGRTRGGARPERNCEGTVVAVPPTPVGVFRFTGTGAEATNLADPFPFDNAGTTGQVQFDRGSWSVEGSAFTFNLAGTGTANGKDFTYRTTVGFQFAQNTHCGQVNFVHASNDGPSGADLGPYVFPNSLTVTGNVYAPTADERHTEFGYTINGSYSSVDPWTATVERSWETRGERFDEIALEWLHEGVVRKMTFVWNSAYGIVAFSDPYFPGGPCQITFPGYAAP